MGSSTLNPDAGAKGHAQAAAANSPHGHAFTSNGKGAAPMAPGGTNHPPPSNDPPPSGGKQGAYRGGSK